MEIPGGSSIGRRAAKDVIFILPHTCRRKHSIPEIELGLRESGMAGNDFMRNIQIIRQEIAIFSLLVAKLIPGGE